MLHYMSSLSVAQERKELTLCTGSLQFAKMMSIANALIGFQHFCSCSLVLSQPIVCSISNSQCDLINLRARGCCNAPGSKFLWSIRWVCDQRLRLRAHFLLEQEGWGTFEAHEGEYRQKKGSREGPAMTWDLSLWIPNFMYPAGFLTWNDVHVWFLCVQLINWQQGNRKSLAALIVGTAVMHVWCAANNCCHECCFGTWLHRVMIGWSIA